MMHPLSLARIYRTEPSVRITQLLGRNPYVLTRLVIVWAKIRARRRWYRLLMIFHIFPLAFFPYWPAVIVEPGDPAIRPELLQEFEQKIEDESRHDMSRKVYIVQFYDTRRTWYVHCATSP